MKKLNTLRAALTVTAALMLPLAHAATGMPKADYEAGKTRISASHKANKAACVSLAGNAKDICEEEAKGQEKVARAELEFAYTGKPRDGEKVAEVKAESAYAVAKEKCDDLAGNPKDVCEQEAKAAQAKALADAKLSRQVGDARSDAAQTKRDADYKVATEKCDALASDAKNQCMAAAKRNFGKM